MSTNVSIPLRTQAGRHHPTAPSTGTQRLQEIDSLRGLAALWVVFFHLTYGVAFRFLKTDPELAARIAPTTFNSQGLLAVDLFFMISGFVIFMTLERSTAVTDFAVSRFSRLYPAYWACLTVSTAVILLLPVVGQTLTLAQIAANVTMANAFLGFEPVETAYWSLALELAFYVIMAGVFRVGLAHRIESLGAIWLALSALVFTIRPEIGAMIPWRIQIGLALAYAPLFFAGILLYRIRSRGWTWARAILLALCVTIRLTTFHGFPLVLGTALIFAIFIPAALGWLRFLRWRPLVFLGSISYPLYLIHGSIGYRVQFFAVTQWGANAMIGFCLALGVVLVLAWGVTTVIERPVQQRIRTAYRRKMQFTNGMEPPQSTPRTGN